MSKKIISPTMGKNLFNSSNSIIEYGCSNSADLRNSGEAAKAGTVKV